MNWLSDLIARYAVKDPSFQWPTMLWLLVVVPLIMLLYVWLLARKRKRSRQFASLTMIEAAAKPGTKIGPIRRHGPAVLLLLGITTLILAVARPQAIIMLPSRVDSIILAMDVSGSMPRAGSAGCRSRSRARSASASCRSHRRPRWSSRRPTSARTS